MNTVRPRVQKNNCHTAITQALSLNISLPLVKKYWYQNFGRLIFIRYWSNAYNERGCVRSLKLCENCDEPNEQGNNLRGSLPSSIGDFSNIDTIVISSNPELVGGIPPEIGQLEHLRVLHLSRNSLSGAITPEMGELESLTSLNLSSNSLSDAIPPEMGDLCELVVLDLSNNMLTGELPAEISLLENLTSLDISNNNLEGLFPTEFGIFCNLENVNMTNDELPDFNDFCNLGEGAVQCILDEENIFCLDSLDILVNQIECNNIWMDSLLVLDFKIGSVFIDSKNYAYAHLEIQLPDNSMEDRYQLYGCASINFETCFSKSDTFFCQRDFVTRAEFDTLSFKEHWNCGQQVPPQLSIFTSDELALSCNNPSITLSAIGSNPDLNLLWTGPDGFMSTAESIQVTEGQAGVYSVRATNAGVACIAGSSITVLEDFTEPNFTLSVLDSLDCSTTSTSLSLVSQDTFLSSYVWLDPSGTIITTGLPNPEVSQAGIYIVQATNESNGCTSQQTIEVIQNAVPPNVTTASDFDLTCTTLEYDLNGMSTNSNVNYSWVGPGGFMSDLANPTVSMMGEYLLTVTDLDNGCINTAIVDIGLDQEAPSVIIPPSVILTCREVEVEITGNTNALNATFIWADPNANIVPEQTITVQQVGTYVLQVTNEDNGCVSIDSVIVSSDMDVPLSAMTSADTINCDSNTTTLSIVNPDDGIDYLWFDSNGDALSGESPAVQEAGIYTLISTLDRNGCTTTSQVEVFTDNTEPLADAGEDQLLVQGGTIMLNAGSSSQGSNFTYLWTGPNGFSQSGATVDADMIGSYTLTVTNLDNGCSASDEIQVEEAPISTLSIISAAGFFEDIINVRLVVGGFIQKESFDFDLSFDSTRFEFVDFAEITNSLPGYSESDIQLLNNNQVSTFWDAPAAEAMDLPDGEILFSFRLKIISTGCAESAVTFDDLTFSNNNSTNFPDQFIDGTIEINRIEGLPCEEPEEICDEIDNITFTNIITPDGNGTNDYLRFSTDNVIEDSKLTIMNRWGNVVYKTENYTNDWSATNNPGGIYFYILEIGNQECKKALTVVK